MAGMGYTGSFPSGSGTVALFAGVSAQPRPGRGLGAGYEGLVTEDVPATDYGSMLKTGLNVLNQFINGSTPQAGPPAQPNASGVRYTMPYVAPKPAVPTWAYVAGGVAVAAGVAYLVMGRKGRR